MNSGKEAEELRRILDSMLNEETGQELAIYIKGTGNDTKLANFLLRGYTR